MTDYDRGEFVRTPNYFFANGPKDRDALQEEFEAMKELGYDAVLDTRLDTGFENAGGIELRNQAKFHPVKFLQQLAKRASEQGVQVFERARVESVSGEGPFVLKVGRHSVKAPRVAIMTYQPLENPWQVFAKKGMYVSYVFEVEIPAGIIAEGTYEDTDNPYHYFRVDRGDGKDRLIIGGEDHREEIPLPAHKSRAALREYLETLMDGRPYTIVRQWSGPILEPADGLALIGDVAPGHFVATAFSGNGMTYAGIAALMLADAIGGRTGPWAKLYDPKRWPTPGQLMRKGRDYAAELIFGAGRNLFR